MILEVERVRFGLGVRLQHWRETRHVILHVGTIESRVIVPKARKGGSAFVVGLLLCGLMAGVIRL